MKIAVVIPALDEAEEIAAAIESARCGLVAPTRSRRSTEVGSGNPVAPAADPTVTEESPSSNSEPALCECEIVVVDGGSRDATREQARAAGARVLEAPLGRARQLQAGFEATQGDPVLFLHADTRLPSGWGEATAAALRDPAVVGGAFRFGFLQSRSQRLALALRVVEAAARLRVVLFGLPYGDQAIFARRSVLEEMGGVPQVSLMEDLDLVSALKRRGRLARVPLTAPTSGRRHVAGGVFSTALRHNAAALAWRFGVDRERIARWLGRNPA